MFWEGVGAILQISWMILLVHCWYDIQVERKGIELVSFTIAIAWMMLMPILAFILGRIGIVCP